MPTDTTVKRRVFVAARNRAAYDDWIGSFVHDGRTDYEYVAGPASFTDDNFMADYDGLHFLDHWALNDGYSVQFVHRLTNPHTYY